MPEPKPHYHSYGFCYQLKFNLHRLWTLWNLSLTVFRFSMALVGFGAAVFNRISSWDATCCSRSLSWASISLSDWRACYWQRTAMISIPLRPQVLRWVGTGPFRVRPLFLFSCTCSYLAALSVPERRSGRYVAPGLAEALLPTVQCRCGFNAFGNMFSPVNFSVC